MSLTPVHTEEPDGRGLEVLIHELGHCIGLTHSAMFPTWDTWPYRYGFQPALWDTDPIMSYGYLPEPGLTADDVAGASLLRPSRGWLERMGSITGRVTMAGRAARYVPVFAMQISGEEFVASAGAFTNGEGSFAIEGLPPGEYLLAAGTMGDISGNTSLVDRGATLGSTDQYLLDPVRVAACAETRTRGNVVIQILPYGHSVGFPGSPAAARILGRVRPHPRARVEQRSRRGVSVLRQRRARLHRPGKRGDPLGSRRLGARTNACVGDRGRSRLATSAGSLCGRFRGVR